MRNSHRGWIALTWLLAFDSWCLGQERIDYERQIRPILNRYCVGCHNDDSREGDLSLSTYSQVLGDDRQPMIQPGNAARSHLLQVVQGEIDPKMPPDGEPAPNPEEVNLLRLWIDQGARGADGTRRLSDWIGPVSQEPSDRTLIPTAMAYCESNQAWYAGYYGGCAKMFAGRPSVTSHAPAGRVQQILAPPGRKGLYVVSGMAGVGGQLTILDRETFETRSQWEVGDDIPYAVAVTSDEKQVALGGYDRLIRIVDTATGAVTKVLHGHHGPIYALAIDPSNRVLASASGDETVKIWNLETGERIDTLSQPEGSQRCVSFDAAGRWLIAGGDDRRLRVWSIDGNDIPRFTLFQEVFAHEEPILAMGIGFDGSCISAGKDHWIKQWRLPKLELVGAIGKTVDVPSALVATAPTNEVVALDLAGNLQPFPTLPIPAESTPVDRLPSVGSVVQSEPALSSEFQDVEPNQTWKDAQAITLPAEVRGTVEAAGLSAGQGGEDWFSFPANKGDTWVLEVDAGNESPLDAKIEIFDRNGQPLLQTRLQAVRESYFTFRGKNSEGVDDFRLHGWEEMELNEYLYAGGEVVKLWLYPRGPDSGFKVYPGFGKRFNYFSTTATSHSLGEPVWIVRELGSSEKAIPNGLPVFPIYFENDDDPLRLAGSNARLTFSVPETDTYFLRIHDSRGEGGEDYTYHMHARKPSPNFQIDRVVKELDIVPGNGRECEFEVTRLDGFSGPIRIEASNGSQGYLTIPPIDVEAGQHRAVGTIWWTDAALEHPDQLEVAWKATADLGNGPVEVPLSMTTKVKKGKGNRVKIQWVHQDADAVPSGSTQQAVHVVTLEPGRTVRAKVRVERNGFQGDIGFGGDDSGRNLPHGVIVSNIGLSGLLVPAGEVEQDVFLTASAWMQPQERRVHLRANIEGNPISPPILLRIVPKHDMASRIP